MKLVVYMPALNEEENIQKVLAHLPVTMEGIDEIRYLVVDDGSTDRTGELAQAAGAEVIAHGRNLGVGAAFHSAVDYALENQVDILVGIDADGQFRGSEIPKMIAPILAGHADMVIGNRFTGGKPAHMSKIKYWGNTQVAKIISYISDENYADVSCGFRAYSRDALLRMNLFGAFTYTHETILSLLFQGQRVAELPVHVDYFPERKSRVAGSITSYAYETSKIIFRVLLDYKPMRVFGTFGSVLILIGMAFVLFLLGHYAFTGAFTPYKSFGFIGLGFFIFGLLVILIALVSDMINRLRVNQDRLLYELKKKRYKNS